MRRIGLEVTDDDSLTYYLLRLISWLGLI